MFVEKNNIIINFTIGIFVIVVQDVFSKYFQLKIYQNNILLFIYFLTLSRESHSIMFFFNNLKNTLKNEL